KGVAEPVGLQRVDHVVANVEEGKMDYWVEFYGKVFGFSQLISFDDKDISTEYSALRSKVMRNPSGTVKFPINEPAKGKRKSQIQEYLDYFKGAGVQHLAISTDNLIATVTRLQQRGIEFLNTPDSYYAELPNRVGGISERIDDLKKLRILVDKDEKGYMLQIFTKPLQDRPTLFFELIQRRGSESFGKGNFKALFESIEQEQAKRGNL
ncbi:4-hydroxyphenylpyruvate dioxygenase, partial [Candidatus Bathyarchaeota archaeon]